MTHNELLLYQKGGTVDAVSLRYSRINFAFLNNVVVILSPFFVLYLRDMVGVQMPAPVEVKQIADQFPTFLACKLLL